jgi:alkylated DNA repair dioxygenase AlkB
MTAQSTLFDPVMNAPPGFGLQADFLSAAEERALLSWLETLSYEPYRHRGFDALRQVAWFGLAYQPEQRRLQQAQAFPGELADLRRRAASFAGIEPDALVHALINRYEAGAPIGWHRDRPQFGIVIGVSLGADTVLRMRRREDGGRFSRVNVPLPRRSIYRLSGPARHSWEHSIAPHEARRFSITLRTLAKPPPG